VSQVFKPASTELERNKQYRKITFSTTLTAMLVLKLLVTCLISVHCATDYYELLGISRDASKAEIRRAFKKMALEKHPDKNTQDPKAHETFTTINKAYETLKDDELRKKYDAYGEEGLKDDHFSNQYQSWDYYNEQFGIYDNDPEIITLSHSDFEQAVSGTSDVWFINFYSPHCSHCHTVAPTWRDVARELAGVVRMGAVNCQDDWGLCNMQGIRQYPSLRVYPSGEDYNGDHEKEAMISYLLNFLNIKQSHLDIKMAKSDDFKNKNYVISFCEESQENCLAGRNVMKLTVMLDKLVEVIQLNCEGQSKVCKHFGKTEGVVFYPNGCADNDCGVSISSLDANEIMEEVMSRLPQPISIDDEKFKDIDNNIYQSKSPPWVLVFLEGDEKDMEIVKLAALIPELKIAKAQCNKARALCTRFHIHKYPTVILLKKRGFEYHHGRYNAHDVANFARESVDSNVITLQPKDFPAVATDTENNWYIDFFTPWCPPCMKLLPEWRKAGNRIGDKIAYFGTVDCTLHTQLCSNYNIRSYPTTIFYNKSTPHTTSGYHSADEIINFAEDILDPPVVKLTPESFASLVNNKPIGETWLVDFYAPWCGPCMELAPTYRQLAKKLGDQAKLGEVDCQMYGHFCSAQNVNSYPSVRLYPHYSEGTSQYLRHQGWRDLDSLYTWVFQSFPSLVDSIDDQSFFNTVLASKQAYLVDFFANWCGHCHEFAPHYEELAKKLEGKIKLAKIDCAHYRGVCRQAGVRQYPTVKLYVGAVSDDFSQSIQGETINSLETEYIEIVALQTVEEHKERMKAIDDTKIVHDEM